MGKDGRRAGGPTNAEAQWCYAGRKPFAFVSYSHKDEAEVLKTLGELWRHGMRLWYDTGIEGGEGWRAAIESRIEACELVLYFHSANSATSPECVNEITFANSERRKIVPIRLDDARYPEGTRLFLTGSHYVSASDRTAEELAGEIMENALVKPCLGSIPSEGGTLPTRGELKEKGYLIISEMCTKWREDGRIPKDLEVSSPKMNEQLSGMPLIKKEDGNWVPTKLGELLGIRSYEGIDKEGARFTNVAYGPQLREVIYEMLIDGDLKG